MTYQVCTRCVMDTSDPQITFDAEGVCSHCTRFTTVSSRDWYPNEEGRRRWKAIADEIKERGRGQEYDCILGLSGGVDSSYLALVAKEAGLRPLALHVDAGWNSELAVANIETIVKYCGFDLHTHVVDWEEIRDLQLAYMRSGIWNQDVPQDHVFFSNLYHYATSNGIHTLLLGGNLATEGIFPTAWDGSAMDAISLKAIHRKFGERPLRSYRTISFLQYYFWFPMIKRMRTIRPLNFMPYNKNDAVTRLEAIGWRAYGRKHGESIFTKLFQNHYLPVRFGYDKRLPHLSSLIVSGQMTRDEAVAELGKPLYDPKELEIDIAYFCKKMRISRAEFDAFIKAPLHTYTEFPNWDRSYRILKKIQRKAESFLGRRINVYS